MACNSKSKKAAKRNEAIVNFLLTCDDETLEKLGKKCVEAYKSHLKTYFPCSEVFIIKEKEEMSDFCAELSALHVVCDYLKAVIWKKLRTWKYKKVPQIKPLLPKTRTLKKFKQVKLASKYDIPLFCELHKLLHKVADDVVFEMLPEARKFCSSCWAMHVKSMDDFSLVKHAWKGMWFTGRVQLFSDDLGEDIVKEIMTEAALLGMEITESSENFAYMQLKSSIIQIPEDWIHWGE